MEIEFADTLLKAVEGREHARFGEVAAVAQSHQHVVVLETSAFDSRAHQCKPQREIRLRRFGRQAHGGDAMFVGEIDNDAEHRRV